MKRLPNGKKRNIDIDIYCLANTSKQEKASVPAIAYADVLALHLTGQYANAITDGRWTVTHIPSGMAVDTFNSKRTALSVIRGLLDLGMDLTPQKLPMKTLRAILVRRTAVLEKVKS